MIGLAPMVGLTDGAFRRLCVEHGAAFTTTEMVEPRKLLLGGDEAAKLVSAPEGDPPIIQICADEPTLVQTATRLIADSVRIEQIEINLSCPHPAVTGLGGGAALLWKPAVVRTLISIARDACPKVSLKLRAGIEHGDDAYLDIGRVADEENCTSITLHARSAAQQFAGRADWETIRRLTEAVSVPVIGNGDLWAPSDARRMLDATGCHSTASARGALGRPWLFTLPSDAIPANATDTHPVYLRGVADAVSRHAYLAGSLYGEEEGTKRLRKHLRWYCIGFDVPLHVRAQLEDFSDLSSAEHLFDDMDPDQIQDTEAANRPRGKTSSEWQLALPREWSRE